MPHLAAVLVHDVHYTGGEASPELGRAAGEVCAATRREDEPWP